VGGVINIVTRSGQTPFSASAHLEGGSFETFRQSATLGGQLPGFRWSITGAHVSTRGISQADEAAGNTETDPYSRTNLNTRLAGNLLPWLELGLALGYLESRLSYDTFRDGHPADDPNLEQRVRQLLSRVHARASLADGRWIQVLSVGFLRDEMWNDNAPDLADPSSSASRFVGRRWMADWQHTVRPWNDNTLLGVVSFKDEAASGHTYSSSSFGESDTDLPPSSITSVAAALQDQQRLFDALELRGSVRLDHHAIFGNAWTYTFAAAFAVPGTGTFLRASYGTAFTAPSLQQLKDPTYGNPDLRPERSRSAEAGVEQELAGRALRLGVTGFTTDVDDLFSFDPVTFKSINIGSARINGVESFVGLHLGVFRTRVDYTWMHPFDRTTGQDLVRRPRNKVSGTVDLVPGGRWTLSLRGSWVGRRTDTDFSTFQPSTVSLHAYLLLAAAASFEVSPHVKLLARVENLLDQKYSEVLGYGTPGIGAYGAVEIRL
jgi:vitamin B12 transporter